MANNHVLNLIFHRIVPCLSVAQTRNTSEDTQDKEAANAHRSSGVKPTGESSVFNPVTTSMTGKGHPKKGVEGWTISYQVTILLLRAGFV